MLITAAALALGFAAACFQSLDGTALVYIGNVPQNSQGAGRTAVPDADELANMIYKASFSGPGGIVNEEFKSGGSIRLAAGTWRVIVKAYAAEGGLLTDSGLTDSGIRLRGLAEQSLQVSPGGVYTITLRSCIGIQNKQDLQNVLSGDSSFDRYIDRDPSIEICSCWKMILMKPAA